ncbi:unnamed protein product [Chrysoparadoxa australica]
MNQSLLILNHVLIFLLSLGGIILQRTNLLILIICLEILLLSVNLNFVLFSVYLDDILGQVSTLLVLGIAAAESVIGLGLVLAFFGVRGSLLLHKSFLRA